MAARKKENTAEIITETAEEQPVKTASAGSDMTFVACALPLGITYDDGDNGAGGSRPLLSPASITPSRARRPASCSERATRC